MMDKNIYNFACACDPNDDNKLVNETWDWAEEVFKLDRRNRNTASDLIYTLARYHASLMDVAVDQWAMVTVTYPVNTKAPPPWTWDYLNVQCDFIEDGLLFCLKQLYDKFGEM